MEEKTITIFAKWQVKEGHLDTVLHLLKEAVAKSSQEEGNLKYEVYQGNENDHTIMLLEQYKDQAAADIHRNSPHFQNVVVSKIVPLLAERSLLASSKVTF